jgi:hypothetical protein
MPTFKIKSEGSYGSSQRRNWDKPFSSSPFVKDRKINFM